MTGENLAFGMGDGKSANKNKAFVRGFVKDFVWGFVQDVLWGDGESTNQIEVWKP